MDKWLKPALDYIPRWLELQMRQSEQPGCVIAVAHRGRVVLEEAFGYTDAIRGTPLTPRHRFRVASHSKSFTAAGVMKLREQRRLKLDDTAGDYVKGLHPAVARATVAQVLSHSAGIVRDGPDTGQWGDRRPFLARQELLADLSASPTLEANTRFKYSNHGYGLVGLIMEAVTGEAYATWIRREIVEAAGLQDTQPDMPLARGTPMARGHSSRLVLGHRVIIPGDNRTNAMSPATGFVSTAADLTRFFGQLSPVARSRVLSVASRREMIRRQWREPHLSIERHYGLGIMSGSLNGWDWFGHSGGFQGFVTRTAVLPVQDITISVLTNAGDGLAHFWLEGAIHVLRSFAQNGAPSRRVRDWSGRWWSSFGAIDLVPMGHKVLIGAPAFFNPFLDASEISVSKRNEGRIALATGSASHGEPVHLTRSRRGKIIGIKLAGTTLLSERKIIREMQARYEGERKGRGKSRRAQRKSRSSA